MIGWPLPAVLNVTYAYLVERADHADSVAVPAYQVAQVDPKDIEGMSRRVALDDWLNSPIGDAAADEEAVLAYLTS